MQVTSNTDHDGPDGVYAGRITATDGENTVVSAIGMIKEKESYDLTVSNLGLDGQPIEAAASIVGVDVDYLLDTYQATTKVRLLKGDYLVDGHQFVGSDVYSLVQPSVSLTRNTTVVLDARKAKPVRITVPNAEASLAIADVGYERRSANGEHTVTATVAFDHSRQVYSAQFGASLPPEQLTGHVSSQWGRMNADQSYDGSPYLYVQLDSMPGSYPTGFRRDVAADQLAVVDQQFNATSDRTVERAVSGVPAGGGDTWAISIPFRAAAAARVLVAAGNASWLTRFDEREPEQNPHPELPLDHELVSRPRTYQAGRTYQERYNAVVLAPSPVTASRAGDRLKLAVAPLSDADGNKGFGPWDLQSSKLIQDGTVIADGPVFGDIEVAGLPAAKTTFTLQAAQTRQPHSTFSTRTEYSWTFSSAGTAEPVTLPMLAVRYRPTVDRSNLAERRPVTALPVIVDTVPGRALPTVVKVRLQVSGDDGKTWREASVEPTGSGAYQAVFSTPKDASTISLKAHLVDAEGNSTDQTVIAAYPLR